MLYKREEAFRFQFQTPLPASLKVVQSDSYFEVKYAVAEILDLSPNGLRFKTSYDIPIKQGDFLLEVTFSLNNKSISMVGTPIWKKHYGSSFIYGFCGLQDRNTEKEIIATLKEFVKNLRASKKE